MMNVRLATPEDEEFIATLSLEAARASSSPWREAPREQIETRARAWQEWGRSPDLQSVTLIATDEQGQRLGYVVLILNTHDELTGEPQGFVADITVAPGVRRRGVGAALLRAAEDYAAGQGLPYLALSVSSFNAPALRLYQRLGYQEEWKKLVKRLKGGRQQ
jgi:ribosomal protein S18 acetylase RimI-like enzyme